MLRTAVARLVGLLRERRVNYFYALDQFKVRIESQTNCGRLWTESYFLLHEAAPCDQPKHLLPLSA